MPALVTNTGTILADGGTVTLSAAAADGLIKTLVAAGGQIGAGSAGGAGGTLVLDAVGGSIAIEGALTATGLTGGQVQATASNAVRVAAGARVDVSGAAKGGVVALGTTLARAVGGPAVGAPNTARRVKVARGATIAADAAADGNGGTVAVLSTRSTVMDGAITARGGNLGGSGGAVEVSGGSLGLAGSVDVGAAAGRPGSVLLDPGVLIIGTTGSPTVSPTLTAPGSTTYEIAANAGDPSDTVLASALTSIGSGSIVLQASTLIDVATSVTFAPGSSVTLQSGGAVNIGSITGPAVTLWLRRFSPARLRRSRSSPVSSRLHRAGRLHKAAPSSSPTTRCSTHLTFSS